MILRGILSQTLNLLRVVSKCCILSGVHGIPPQCLLPQRLFTDRCCLLWMECAPEVWPCAGLFGNFSQRVLCTRCRSSFRPGLSSLAWTAAPWLGELYAAQLLKHIQRALASPGSLPTLGIWYIAQLCFGFSVSDRCRASNHLWVLNC